MQLSDEVYGKIQQLCKNGDGYVTKGNIDRAMQCYEEALQLLPDPKDDWEASTWIYTAMGDACFQNKQYHEAISNLTSALKCPNGFGNPFILLRIGESYFEAGEPEKARNYLLQAYMIDGPDIFSRENPKYFEIIRDLT